ncbi:MAG: hypothetical protein JNK72_12995 [Myxococcales bacterium]|nr:hypothetical protein [Myxococcales bacterium]
MDASFDRRLRVATALAVLGLVALTLGPALRGGFAWDDLSLIVYNPEIHPGGSLGRALGRSFWALGDRAHSPSAWLYWRPAVTALNALSWRLGGGAPWVFHAVNLGLHLGVLWLGWGFLRDRQRDPDAPSSQVARALVLAWLAAHASRAESVAWVSGSTDLVMAFAMLLGHALWHRRRWGLAALAACLAALSKEPGFALPALLALDHGRYDENERKEYLRGLGPMVLALGAVLLVRGWLLPPTWQGAAQSPWGVRGLLSALGGMLIETLSPWPRVTVFRPERFVGGLWLGVGVAGFAVLAAAVVWSFTPRGRAGWRGDLGWWWVLLLPGLNTAARFPESLIALRFLYLPLFALGALVLRAWPRTTRGRWAAGVAVLALTAAHAAALRAETAVWHDNETLWRRVLAVDPDNGYAAQELVNALATDRGPEAARVGALAARRALDRGDVSAATALAVRALSAQMYATPGGDGAALRALAAVYDGLAEGRATTMALGGTALTLRPRWRAEGSLRDPVWFELPRAVLALRRGERAEARGAFEGLARVPETRLPALTNLAQMEGQDGHFDAALRALDEADAMRAPDAFRVGLRAQLEAGRELLLRPDHPARSIALAELSLALGGAASCERWLQGFGEEAPPRVTLLRIRARVMQGDLRGARALATAAAARDPAHAAAWSRVMTQLGSTER